MYAIPWYVVLFVSFPETILVLLLGFKLFNIYIDFKRVIIISLLNCIFVYFIRQFPIPFGVHTLLLVIIEVLLSAVIAKIRFMHSLICIMTGGIIMGVLQSLMLPVITSITNAGVNELSIQPVLNILMFIPLGTIMLSMFFMVKKYDLIIYDLSLHGE